MLRGSSGEDQLSASIRTVRLNPTHTGQGRGRRASRTGLAILAPRDAFKSRTIPSQWTGFWFAHVARRRKPTQRAGCRRDGDGHRLADYFATLSLGCGKEQKGQGFAVDMCSKSNRRADRGIHDMGLLRILRSQDERRPEICFSISGRDGRFRLGRTVGRRTVCVLLG